MTDNNESKATLIPGDPVAWQWRQTYAGRWGNWNDCGLSATDVQKWLDLAQKLPDEVQVRPLYAAPAPLPVAVKVKPLEWKHDGHSYYAYCGVTDVRWTARSTEEMAQKDEIRATRIRSALSAPVGGMEESQTEKLGRFGHHPDPAIDFCVEVEAIEGEFFNLSVGFENGTPSHEELTARVEKAMSFRVGGDENSVLAKETLRGIDAKLRSSPTPASDITALREAGERLLKACDAYDSDEMHTDDSVCAYSDALEDFRSALQHVAKEERG